MTSTGVAVNEHRASFTAPLRGRFWRRGFGCMLGGPTYLERSCSRPLVDESEAALRTTIASCRALHTSPAKTLFHEIDDGGGLSAGLGEVTGACWVSASRYQEVGDDLVDNRLDEARGADRAVHFVAMIESRVCAELVEHGDGE